MSGGQALAQGATNSITRPVTKAVLTGPSGRIDFQYNPTEISISHNAEGFSDPIGKKEPDDRSVLSGLATRGSTRLILSTLTFTGSQCQTNVARLMKWVKPSQPQQDGKPQRERLQFQWGSAGSGFLYEAELMRFDCTYTRFTSTGQPIRVEIRNLTLHVYDEEAASHDGQAGPLVGSTALPSLRPDSGLGSPGGANKPLGAMGDLTRASIQGMGVAG
ncbi:hypothetical protein AB0D66_29320 [Streptomyces sp. NPDC048270]|uniref:CIS tube protein n=1 Tax=Streptomyces sp. NPDC048270 TaxID=3154615 RepID=UPI0033BFFD65